MRVLIADKFEQSGLDGLQALGPRTSLPLDVENGTKKSFPRPEVSMAELLD